MRDILQWMHNPIILIAHLLTALWAPHLYSASSGSKLHVMSINHCSVGPPGIYLLPLNTLSLNFLRPCDLIPNKCSLFQAQCPQAPYPFLSYGLNYKSPFQFALFLASRLDKRHILLMTWEAFILAPEACDTFMLPWEDKRLPVSLPGIEKGIGILQHNHSLPPEGLSAWRNNQVLRQGEPKGSEAGKHFLVAMIKCVTKATWGRWALPSLSAGWCKSVHHSGESRAVGMEKTVMSPDQSREIRALVFCLHFPFYPAGDPRTPAHGSPAPFRVILPSPEAKHMVPHKLGL